MKVFNLLLCTIVTATASVSAWNPFDSGYPDCIDNNGKKGQIKDCMGKSFF